MKTTRFLGANVRRAGLLAGVLVAATAFAACNTDQILDVTDPDIINPSDVTTLAGADALRLGALYRFQVATTGTTGTNSGDTEFLISGMLADEWRSSDTFLQRNQIDRRAITTDNGEVDGPYRLTQRVRLAATQAAEALSKFSAPSWQVAQMYIIEAYAENQLAEDFCSSIPFSTVVDGKEVLGASVGTKEAFELALAHVDSALALVTRDGEEGEDMFNAASVLKGRVLLNLERFSEAEAAVADVPTDYAWVNEHSDNTVYNAAWSFNNSVGRLFLGNGEGTNGIDFFGADDPRLPVCQLPGKADCESDTPVSKPFDPSTPAGPPSLAIQQKWPTRTSSVDLMTGVEARLIEAEAQLKASGPVTAFATLNTLRGTVPGLTPLVPAATTAGQVDQLFRERAFWLWGTGHRLGDLRRLVRTYDRATESVYPTGAWWKGGDYGTDVNIVIPQSEEANEGFNRAACDPTDVGSVT
jgi:hypothetical protein